MESNDNNDVVLFFCDQWVNTLRAAPTLLSKSAKMIEKMGIDIS